MKAIKSWIYENPFWTGCILAGIIFGGLYLFGG
jgi:hypothetical protein